MRQLAARIGKRLKASRAMLVTAESCTGGWVAQAVTAVAGSSDWFERGFVTYSNDSKRELLGVRADTLARHGAVSEEAAREMASGALRQSKASLSVAVTGIADRAAAVRPSPWAPCALRGSARTAGGMPRRGGSQATAKAFVNSPLSMP